ncbi:MAG: hypothetical protein OXN89_18810 [Bryobacterales bacterium]|nr:hypothetical protein [Bryobacterales bacterium]
MAAHQGIGKTPLYRVWLRQGGPSNRQPHGTWDGVRVTKLGIAAARETLVTATPHMAAIWTDLFESMLVPGCCQLRWAGDGPGIGRDARIAYSGMLGRYMARAHLTEHAGIRVLVPLDVAKRSFEGSPYQIRKPPHDRGHEADWIGLDGHGLVIVEAKGSYDPRIGAWHGPRSVPQCLDIAIEQARRTRVFSRRRGSSREVPAKRWAIASRWGTEDKPALLPTLVAWDCGVSRLNRQVHRELEELLLRADLGGVMEGLGHSKALEPRTGMPLPEVLGSGYRLRIGDLLIEPGFASVLGPLGVRPLRSNDDLRLVRQALEDDIGVAIASLSERYLSTVVERGEWLGAGRIRAEQEVGSSTVDSEEHDVAAPSVARAGLTVAWPRGAGVAIQLER